MTRNVSLLLCLFLTSISLAIGYLIGVVAVSREVGNGARSQTSEVVRTARVRVERWEPPEKVFASLGEEALVFRYSGGDLRFWIEIESSGKKKTLGENLIPAAAAPGPGQVVEGHFVWVRHEADESGKELWTVAMERDLVFRPPQPSGVLMATAQSRTGRAGMVVQLWDHAESEEPNQGSSSTGERVPAAIRSSSSWGTVPVPRPLPTDRQFCICAFEAKSGDSDYNTLSRHVIRVMCRVAAEKDLAAAPDHGDDFAKITEAAIVGAIGDLSKAAEIAQRARLLATCPEDRQRDGKKAQELAQKACELTHWQNAGFVDTLAAACAAAGQFADAVKWQKKAMADPVFAEREGERARARLALYEAGKPYREQPPASPAAAAGR